MIIRKYLNHFSMWFRMASCRFAYKFFKTFMVLVSDIGVFDTIFCFSINSTAPPPIKLYIAFKYTVRAHYKFGWKHWIFQLLHFGYEVMCTHDAITDLFDHRFYCRNALSVSHNIRTHTFFSAFVFHFRALRSNIEININDYLHAKKYWLNKYE